MKSQTNYTDINKLIDTGEFSEATSKISQILIRENLSISEKYNLNFEIERMKRIRKDFSKTQNDIINYLKNYYPEISSVDLQVWEKDGTLEHKIIDGKKLYFNRSHTNLFRINPDAKKTKIKVDGDSKDDLDLFLEKYLESVNSEIEEKSEELIKPQKIKFSYKLSVKPNVVPEGEIIRCWLPYPKEVHERQSEIKLLSVNSEEYIIAPDDYSHRTIYLEKKAIDNQSIEFSYSLQYTGKNQKVKIKPENIISYDKETDLYKKYTSERLPHIYFSDKIKILSKKIVGDETNKFLIAKKIFKWINDNIPWAGAREYSTIRSLSDYCLSNGWGDCGIKTLTFMSLARYNGIPAKWQSGWMLHPGSVNLHDWGEIYFEGIGWVPIDQSFGLVDSDNENIKWFYLGGIDAYHLIINDDYSQPLYPAKIYPRSETVDFQRGEVEWKGGNLYFDQWTYKMEVDYLDN